MPQLICTKSQSRIFVLVSEHLIAVEDRDAIFALLDVFGAAQSKGDLEAVRNDVPVRFAVDRLGVDTRQRRAVVIVRRTVDTACRITTRDAADRTTEAAKQRLTIVERVRADIVVAMRVRFQIVTAKHEVERTFEVRVEANITRVLL